MKVYSIRECSRLMADAFQKDYIFKNITVSGTVSNLHFHFSGVIFFSLIDKEFRITCRIGKMRSTFLGRRIKNGTEILILGNIKYDKISGKPIFQVDRILSSTQSPIVAKLDMLKKELETLGYFDIEKKRRLPLFPFRIGIITSESGAVIYDIIRTGFLRNNSVRYSLYSTTVQGENAAANMAEMVIRANRETEPPDILIIARGGGAEEDLMPFNQRVLLDAVFCSKIPVISAVGHETDTTLLDLTADVRASTPTQAAEIAVLDKKYIEERIICLYLVLQKIIWDKLNISKLKLQHTLIAFNILAQSGKVTAVRKDILYNWIMLDRKLKKAISNKKLDILERIQILSRCGMEDILICSKHIKGADDGKEI